MSFKILAASMLITSVGGECLLEFSAHFAPSFVKPMAPRQEAFHSRRFQHIKTCGRKGRQTLEEYFAGPASRRPSDILQTKDRNDVLDLEDLQEMLSFFAAEFREQFRCSGGGSAADSRGLTYKQLAREKMLGVRLPDLDLSRTIVSSEGSVAGLGLFAARDLAEGELITCYPGDALIRYPAEHITFGTHVPEDLRDPDLRFGQLKNYGVTVDENYVLVGIPDLDQDPAYLGHFCNDGVRLRGGEDGVDEYLSETERLQNAVITDLDDLHMVSVALRDIQQGEEIFVSYGIDYWIRHDARHFTPES